MEFNRCCGCMRELPVPGAVCSECGYDNTNGPRLQESHALPCRTLLHGKYVIGKTIGQGGFGLTYIGWDLALETAVCLKEYFPNGAAMRDASRSTAVYWSSGGSAQELHQGQESFLREARKAVKLRDLPSVVTVWDVFQENNTAYLIMDYIEGMTLKKHLIQSGRPMSESECTGLLLPVMADLEKVHQRGIIHRDISPDNLMLRSDGKLILLDIGAAKDLSRGAGQSSFVVAKKGFSPLEQYTQSGEIGAWTDVYAMCATIVYCVTGKLLPEPLERLTGKNIDLSAFTPAFAKVLEKGLAIKPKDRIQSMSELSAQLEAAIDVSPKPPRPLPLILGIAAALIIALSVFVWIKVWPQNPVDTESAAIMAKPQMNKDIAEPTPEPTPETTPAQTLKMTSEPTLVPAAEPVITGQPQSVTAEAGEDVTFTVKASGEDLRYQWQYRVSDVGSWYASSMVGSTTDKLLVAAAITNDGFQYRCKVSSSVGTVYSDPAKLTVNSNPASVQSGSEKEDGKADVGDLLLGHWGEEEAIHNGKTTAYYLNSPVYDCREIRMDLTIRSSTGYPYGDWALYLLDMSGNWYAAAGFKLDEAQADGRTTTYNLRFDSPQTFQALTICPAEKGMEQSIQRVLLFYCEQAAN